MKNASAIVAASAHHGRSKRLTWSTRWRRIRSRCGAKPNHAMSPMAAPTVALTTPTTAPLASITKRTCRSVAPIDSSMPRARSRRWAITVKPEMASKPMNSMPTVLIASMIAAACAVLTSPPLCTLNPDPSTVWNDFSCASVASANTDTRAAGVACPGGTRTNSSDRLSGFSTMPTT